MLAVFTKQGSLVAFTVVICIVSRYDFLYCGKSRITSASAAIQTPIYDEQSHR